MDEQKRRWHLVEKRLFPVPTWRGWVFFLIVATLLSWLCLHRIYSFLATYAPVQTNVLVVEGWAPDYAMRLAVDEFKTHPYERLYVTGGPIERGAPLSEYTDYATLGCAVLVKFGLPTNAVQAVPAPFVPQDRTYTSAIALRQWFESHRGSPVRLNLLTIGPHARRSRLLFRKAFGNKSEIGIIALPENDFDPKHWWRSSQGFRSVTSELIAYIYATLLFHPSSRNDQPLNQ